MSQSERQRRYEATEKGHARRQRYEATEKYRAKRQRYEQSEKGQVRRRRRVHIGRRYVGQAATVADAARIDAHIKERLSELVTRRRDDA